MHTVERVATFDSTTLLWRTRGCHWDYEFVAIPDNPNINSWWDVFNQIFGGNPELTKGPIFSHGELSDPRPRPFVAVAFSDATLRDEQDRPICHYLAWFPDILPGAEFDQFRAKLSGDWPQQILNTLRSDFESRDVFDLTEIELRDFHKEGRILGTYLLEHMQKNGKTLELKETNTENLTESDHINIVPPMPMEPRPTQTSVGKNTNSKIKSKIGWGTPIVVAALIFLTLVYSIQKNPPLNPEKTSIAIMPFQYDQTNQQFTSINQTILKKLISKLAKKNTLKVSHYDKITKYIGCKFTISEIAEKLKVQHVVTSTLYAKDNWVWAVVKVTNTGNSKSTKQILGLKQKLPLRSGWMDAMVKLLSSRIQERQISEGRLL